GRSRVKRRAGRVGAASPRNPATSRGRGFDGGRDEKCPGGGDRDDRSNPRHQGLTKGWRVARWVPLWGNVYGRSSPPLPAGPRKMASEPLPGRTAPQLRFEVGESFGESGASAPDCGCPIWGLTPPARRNLLFYLIETLAPPSSSFFLIVSASCLETFS